MYVTPLPGVTVDLLLESLRTLHSRLATIRGGGQDVQSIYAAYLEWVRTSDQVLRRQIRPADLDALILTRRQWALQTFPPSDDLLQRPLRSLLGAEIDQRIDTLDETISELRARAELFQLPGKLIMADTSFYIQHRDKLAETAFADVLDEREVPIHLLVPIVVVDELDGLKQAGRDHTRWRARHTLAELDRALPGGSGRGRLRAEDFSGVGSGAIPRGEVTVEILFDPPSHRRLPINDDEIIDRALTAQALAGREVTLLTYDTGHSTRARSRGLPTRKLAMPREQ